MCMPILDFVATVYKKWQASKFVAFFPSNAKYVPKKIFFEKKVVI